MEDISLHILDIVENSLNARASLVEIRIIEDTKKDMLQITIKDNGKGMDPDMVRKVRDPFVTTRTTRKVGLGISLLEQAAKEADGYLELKSEPGKGTEITATFTSSHIDRKPMGDIGSTMISLIIGNPDVDFFYESNIDGDITLLDTKEIKEELDGISISDPAVIKLIREVFLKKV
ncbi:MAG: ATP-binding protein [Spirochaetota bacterium]|nr:ATP-binding protein [Spirochaetota bacterium]